MGKNERVRVLCGEIRYLRFSVPFFGQKELADKVLIFAGMVTENKLSEEIEVCFHNVSIGSLGHQEEEVHPIEDSSEYILSYANGEEGLSKYPWYKELN